jgi:phage terminase large subunit-like protein
MLRDATLRSFFGNVLLVLGAWKKDFLDELEVFPLGTHDDQVDAAAGSTSSPSTNGGG